jgi:Xaa-Pro aminopeptidase
VRVPVLSLVLVLAASSAGAAQITSEEYAQRRATLASRVPDGLFVVRGGESPVQDYLSFFQTNGFLYLTGYREPDAALILN